MEANPSFITIPRLVYWALTLNITILSVMLVKKDPVFIIIKHKERAKALILLTMLLLLFFIQGKWDWLSDTIEANYHDYTTLHKNVPKNTSSENIDYVKWQRDNHKRERDIYLGLATGLTSVLIYVITYYTDKFDRYMRLQAWLGENV